MSTPIERGRYWVFTEKQLAAAVADYANASTANERAAQLRHDLIVEFLNSPECIERGMRRGGEDESQ